MAKLTGPLLSETAHGKLAQRLIFSRKNNINVGRSFHMPHKTITLNQWTQRHIIGLLTAHWQVKTTDEKNVYETLAKTSGLNITGFSYFIKVASADLYTHHGLCGYWPMNESSGNQILDYSGNANHGTLYPSYPPNCPARKDSFQKEYGNALYFDMIDDYIDCGAGNSLNITAEITLEAWINITNETVNRYIITHNLSSIANTQWGLYSLATEKLQFVTEGVSNTTSATIPINTWTHIAFTFKTPTLLFYINGALSQTISQTATLTSRICPTTIGARADFTLGHTFYYKNLMDEIRVYNRILNATEIKKHYELLRLNKHRQPLLIH
jgi:hypothetical protein